MFDIGWQELFIIGLVTIIVIGPKELPKVLRTVTLWVRKIRGMARDFQESIEELAREAELDEMKRELEATAGLDIEKELEHTIDPGGKVGDAVREMDKAVEAEPATTAGTQSEADRDPKPTTAAASPENKPASSGSSKTS